MKGELLKRIGRVGLVGLVGLMGCWARGADTGVHVQFDFYNTILAPQGVRSLVIIPELTAAAGPLGLTTRDRIFKQTGAAGSVTVSNLVWGDYRVEFRGVDTVTTNWLSVPQTNAGTLLNATNLVTDAHAWAGTAVATFSRYNLLAGSNVTFRASGQSTYVDGAAGVITNNQAGVSLSNLTLSAPVLIPITWTEGLNLRGPTGDDGYHFKWFADHLRLSNSVFGDWVDFNSGGLVLGYVDELGNQVSHTYLNGSGISTTGNVMVSLGGQFIGDGSGLTNIPGVITNTQGIYGSNAVTLGGTFRGTNTANNYDLALSSYTNTIPNLTIDGFHEFRGDVTTTNLTGLLQPRTGWLKHPVMGWNMFEATGGGPSLEEKILYQADAAIAKGLIDAGWEYFIIDAGWSTNRDSPGGFLVERPGYFPNGGRYLRDQLHARRAKLGFYLSLSKVEGDPNSHGQEATPYLDIPQDANLIINDYAADYVKVDGPGFLLSGDSDYEYVRQWYELFTRTADDISTTNRPGWQVVVDMNSANSQFGMFNPPRRWWPYRYDQIRLAHDLTSWGDGVNVLANLRRAFNYTLFEFSWMTRRGSFLFNNGSLHIGYNSHPDVTARHTRADYGMATMLCSTLIGANPSEVTQEELDTVFTNGLFLDIVKDDACESGYPVISNATWEVWVRSLVNGDWAVALWNCASNTDVTASINLTNIPGISGNVVFAKDVFWRTNLYITNTLTATVRSNDLNLYRLMPRTQIGFTGIITNITATATNAWVYVNGVVTEITNAFVLPPAPVMTALALWFKTDGYTWDDGTRTNWPDSSGNGYDATTNETYQPYYYSNQVNGLGAFYFWRTNGLATLFTDPYTNESVFIVWTNGNTTANQMIVSKHYANHWSMCPNAEASAPNYTAFRAYARSHQDLWTPVGSSSSALNWNIHGMVLSNSYTFAFLGDGTSTNWNNTTYAPSTTPRALLLGYDLNGAFGSYGALAEMLYYTNTLDATQVSSNLYYLRTKFNLP